jgi:hemolysin activation/secretion protein
LIHRQRESGVVAIVLGGAFIVFGVRCVSLLLCSVALVPSAFAQTVPGQSVPNQVNRDAERLQEIERERQRAREEQFRQSQTAAPQATQVEPQAELAGDAGGCAAVRSVTIKGMTRFAQSDFAADLAKLSGDCVSIADINTVLRTITNRYIAGGYVTSRAVIGPQDLKSGVLEIIVIEGQLEGISSEGVGTKRGYGKRELAAAFPNTKGRQLNLRDLEQGVDQLARLGSAEPDIDITPAELPGASNLIVRRKRVDTPLRASYAVNNEGSANTGRIQSTASLDIDSPLGFADFWSLYYSRDLENRDGRGSEGYGAFVSIPYGYTTLTLSGGRFSFDSILQGVDQAFANTGVSTNGSVTLDHLLFRDAKTKLSVSAGISGLDTVNRIQGIKLRTSSYRLVSGAINFRAQRRIGNGLATADFGFTRGLDIFGANSVDTGPGGAQLVFRKLEASLGYQTRAKAFGVPLNYSGVLRGSAALDPVFPGERFSLGGSSTVRGFRDDGISGRSGLFTRQQIGFPLFSVFGDKTAGTQTSFSGILGYDAGGIRPRKGDAFERGFLHSASVGLRVNNKRVAGEFTLSAPISAPDTVRRKTLELSASLRLSL